MARYSKIGVIGSGTIGTKIIEHILRATELELAFVLVSSAESITRLDLPAGVVTADAEEALAAPVDLVIEAAMPGVLADLAPRFLEGADVCGFSCTALADPAIEQAVRHACAASDHAFYVPHGAILALDGIADGRALLESVTVTTSKSGPSLGIGEDASGILFEGPTREVCARFPRNVNVHAAIALAGLGFDRTVSRVVAVPGLKTMQHHVEVQGQGLEWDIRVSSRSLGGVTGAYTPQSALGSIDRLLGGSGIVVA